MYKEKLEYFDACKIKKYWKNQKPPSNLDQKFVDPYFPPNKSSILGLNENNDWIDPVNGPAKSKVLDCSKIEWKSASNLLGKFHLFDAKIEFDDIKQGNLGNCYFLSAIAALSEMPYLIYQIFRTKKENFEGYYEIVLNIDGEWQIVFVDDYVPVEIGTDKFMFSHPNGSELWAILLEKAWAKINGGYILTISGWPSDPLSAITGFGSEKIVHREYSVDDIWNIVLKADKNDNIMCTSTKNDKNVENVGLVLNHAYTLIGAKEKEVDNKNIRLVRIRNPWGYKEWNGDWSDHSELWTEELRKYFEFVNADDGTFYMSIEDFIKFYDSTHICHIMYNSIVKSIYLDQNSLNSPQVFNLNLENDSFVSISFSFKHWRFNREILNKDHPAAFLIARYDEDGMIYDVDGSYTSLDNLEYYKELQKGTYIIWFYVCQERSEIHVDQVIFSCSSHSQIKIIHVNEDSTFKIAKKLLIEGIKVKDEEKIKKDANFYMGVENQYKKTGLGYRVIINKTSNSYIKYDGDTTKMESVYILPPFSETEKFTVLVPPKEERIIVGIREKYYSSYWFNLQSKYLIIKGQVPNEAYSESVNLSFLAEYMLKDFNTKQVDIIHPLYEYMIITSEKSKIMSSFNHTDILYANIETLKNENPKYMKMVISYKYSKEDKTLKWYKSIVDGGYYIGQVNREMKRQGNGGFIWNEGTYFIGYWENGLKIKGQFFYPDGKMFYDGEFSNGVKHGQGEQMFRDGSKYVGRFENDKKNGKGTFFWPDGSYWKGNFKNGFMNGKGTYYSIENEREEVIYEDGKIID